MLLVAAGHSSPAYVLAKCAMMAGGGWHVTSLWTQPGLLSPPNLAKHQERLPTPGQVSFSSARDNAHLSFPGVCHSAVSTSERGRQEKKCERVRSSGEPRKFS